MSHLTFWEWECPECEHINPRSDADLQARGWIGTIQCANCKRRFELSGLWSHGFAQETAEDEIIAGTTLDNLEG